ncbi:hypothetical protein BKA69DRAFT_1128626 [Paraphysoderma sedebokerense]|nr:hypothetical protein BKA69DRAFT_1128626 [Paraphysoderma sedebokerense]
MKFNATLLTIATLTVTVLNAPQERPAQGYSRGVDTPMDQCAGNEERDDALCYPKCEEGFNGAGPVCWENCASDERDDGLTCFRSIISFRWKKSPGRGVGHPPKSCPGEKEVDQALCYEPCKAGYKGVGPMCHYVGN